MTLHLFLPTGRTYTFRGAQVVADTENELIVEYTSARDGLVGSLHVRKEAIVAWSLKPEEGL